MQMISFLAMFLEFSIFVFYIFDYGLILNKAQFHLKILICPKDRFIHQGTVCVLNPDALVRAV